MMTRERMRQSLKGRTLRHFTLSSGKSCIGKEEEFELLLFGPTTEEKARFYYFLCESSKLGPGR